MFFHSAGGGAAPALMPGAMTVIGVRLEDREG